ncbi:MAG: hypothetical protein V7700_19025 [Halioglobus sp.]
MQVIEINDGKIRPPGLPGRRTNPAEKGVALAIVVWFIAGMSLLVAGIVSHARVDTQMAQLHVARAKVSAAGDGAVNLAMAEFAAGKLPPAVTNGLQPVKYRMGDLEVAVVMVSTSGLINLNSAPGKMLAALFAIVGGVDESEAQRLAASVVDWRRPAGARRAFKSKAGASRFAQIEDLLRVDGVNRALLDAVRDYVVAGTAARGGMDWKQAQKQILAVLEKSDSHERGSLSQRKDLLAGRALEEGGSGIASGGAYRLDAVVDYGGRTWLRRRWVVNESGSASDLPWRMLRTEAPRVIVQNEI